jgi:hypothetical protein
MRPTRTLPALLIALSLASACFGTKHIAELRSRPNHYENRTVSIDGRVTKAWSIPLVPMQFYTVDDGTGDIVVVSNGSRQPHQGDRVHVKGVVEQVGSFGGQSVGLHLRQEHVSISGR